MATTTRAYVPLTLQDLARMWPELDQVVAWSPTPPEETSSKDDVEEAEYFAMLAAAASVVDAALAQGSPRVVLACDIEPAEDPASPVDGLLAHPGISVDPTRVVSAHVDDPELVAALPADREEAAEALADSALLWFDVSEIAQLLEAGRD